MRISKALAGAYLAAAVSLAGPAIAAEALTIAPDTQPADALRYALNALKAGNNDAALGALNFASDKGLISAKWKLGAMYAAGDSVGRDDFHAFQIFSDIANSYADYSPRNSFAPYVSNAFVRLGDYYRSGVTGSVKADPALARQYFAYAASYFGDATAQLDLARMYYLGEGGDRDPVQAARWANLSADKGNLDAQLLVIDISLDLANKHLEGVPSPYDVRQATQWAERAADYGSIDGQALYGKLLFEGDGTTRQPVDGLMYMFIAVARSAPDDISVREIEAAEAVKAQPQEVALAKQRADDWLKKNPVAATGTLTQ